MTPDERAAFVKEAEDHGWTLYIKMIDFMREQKPKPEIALNIVMNLVAAVIVRFAPSLEQAERDAERAGKDIAEMVRGHWMSAQDTGVTAN